jgi:hypothetical protein
MTFGIHKYAREALAKYEHNDKGLEARETLYHRYPIPLSLESLGFDLKRGDDGGDSCVRRRPYFFLSFTLCC